MTSHPNSSPALSRCWLHLNVTCSPSYCCFHDCCGSVGRKSFLCPRNIQTFKLGLKKMDKGFAGQLEKTVKRKSEKFLGTRTKICFYANWDVFSAPQTLFVDAAEVCFDGTLR